MAKIKTALISVADKTGIPEFARRLVALDIEILSTGGTARLLRESDVAVRSVSDYTGFPEILDGSLRTLHPKVYGGLLAHREKEEHLRQMEEHGIQAIDMVVVNLYPLIDAIAQPGLEPVPAIDNIDIGGPTLVRAAAKNYTHVATVTNPDSYAAVAEELTAGGGSLSQKTLLALALAAFRHTAHYDSVIADYLSGIQGEQTTGPNG